MRYILDSSVAVKCVLPEIDSDKAIRIRDDYGKSIHELSAPDIFPVEAGHALTRAERQRRIAQGEARKLLGDILTTAPRFVPYRSLLNRAIDISSSHRVGIYDCLYVALAEREGVHFITADDRLIKNLQPSFPFIVALASFP